MRLIRGHFAKLMAKHNILRFDLIFCIAPGYVRFWFWGHGFTFNCWIENNETYCNCSFISYDFRHVCFFLIETENQINDLLIIEFDSLMILISYKYYSSSLSSQRLDTAEIRFTEMMKWNDSYLEVLCIARAFAKKRINIKNTIFNRIPNHLRGCSMATSILHSKNFRFQMTILIIRNWDFF
jgi:hypothetical protein